jgi:hypothetical protein
MKCFILVLFLAFSIPTFAATCTPPTGGHCVDVSWTASVTGGVTYNVYRGTATGVCRGTKVGSGISAVTFADMNVTNGATYFYAISAQNAGGESACTSEVQVLIPIPPLPPSNPNAIPQ